MKSHLTLIAMGHTLFTHPSSSSGRPFKAGAIDCPHPVSMRWPSQRLSPLDQGRWTGQWKGQESTLPPLKTNSELISS